MPGGVTVATSSRSFIQSLATAPRFALTACCTGVSTWRATKTTPTKVSGPVSEDPSCTAAMSTPVATASNAGIAARSSSSTHQVVASRGEARNSTPKNFHSGRARSRSSTCAPFHIGHAHPAPPAVPESTTFSMLADGSLCVHALRRVRTPGERGRFRAVRRGRT